MGEREGRGEGGKGRGKEGPRSAPLPSQLSGSAYVKDIVPIAVTLYIRFSLETVYCSGERRKGSTPHQMFERPPKTVFVRLCYVYGPQTAPL